MKFEITVNVAELNKIPRAVVPNLTDSIEIIIAGTTFSCKAEYTSFAIDPVYGTSLLVCGRGFDKKAQEIAQAKAEVNRTKEAHKEAQRKLSALMEEDNVK